MSFVDHSREVARGFIRTAVVVDDRAFGLKSDSAAVPGRGLVRPSGARPPASSADPEPAPPGTPEEHPSTESQPEAGQDSAHDLNAEQLIRDFAADGVFCTVLGVEKSDTFESLADRVLPLAHNADVFVTDWVLFEGGKREGGAASDLILRAVEEAETPERFRLIMVYTGTPDLRDVARTISRKLTEAGHANDLDDAGFAITCGAVWITVYAKPQANIDGSLPELAERVVNYDLLVRRAVDEYSAATAGLVSNAALVALTAVRDSTHRLLRTFRPALDAPYLAHRAMLPTPDDAGEHLVQLICDEIRAAIEGSGVESEVSLTQIRFWLDELAGDLNFGPLFREGKVPAGTDGRDIAMGLLELGTSMASDANELTALGSNSYRKKIVEKPHVVIPLTRVFIKGGHAHLSDARELDLEFAALTSLRTRYGTPAPMLTSGVIVRVHQESDDGADRGDAPEYLLCIQPLCDSVRLRDNTRFPFLPLTPVNQKPLEDLKDQGSFGLILPDRNEYVCSKVNYSPSGLILAEFEPSGDRVLFTPDTDAGWSLASTNGTRHTYVAQLKAGQANRVLGQFAQQAARPGLDESEWLRRWAR